MKKIFLFILFFTSFVFSADIKTVYTGKFPMDITISPGFYSHYFSSSNSTTSYLISSPLNRHLDGWVDSYTTQYYYKFVISLRSGNGSSNGFGAAFYTKVNNLDKFSYQGYDGVVSSISNAIKYHTCSGHYLYDFVNNICVASPCSSNQHRNSSGVCVCNTGYAMDQNGSCNCYVGQQQYTYQADQATCNGLTVVKISGLEAFYQFKWNTCLNQCTAQSAPLCQEGYIYNQYGQCVPAVLNNQQCVAKGGTLQNTRITKNSVCVNIDNNGNKNVISPCCQKVADCIDPSGATIGSSSMYVQCGLVDTNATTKPPKCTTCSGNTPIATSDGYCQNSAGTAFNNCPNPANQCKSCPADYPIPNDAGNCLNSAGAFTSCPTPTSDTNSTTNPTPTPKTPICQLCGLLQGGWVAGGNGQCTRTTSAGIVQFASCPGTPESNNTTQVTPNARPQKNSNFSDSNNTIAPTLGHNSGTPQDSNGTKQKRICTTCPNGYTNINGICSLISTNGTIVSSTPCPTPIQHQDTNTSKPLDSNGSDKNITGMANQLGSYATNEIKKAYRSYSIFPTTCGKLQPLPNALLFGGRVTIHDPLPAFRDILQPFRSLIANMLLFIATVIGLFDFFRRS